MQMPKPSYAQIAQKSKETSADNVNSADRSMLESDEVQTTVKDTTQSSSSSGVEPRPQRGSTAAGAMIAESRPAHPHTHSHGRQRAGGHVASSDDMRHRDYNGVASAARPLP